MNNLLCLTLFVLIFIFDPVINSKDENVQISLTETKHTWFGARDKCSLIGNEHTNITIPNLNSDLMWTGDSGRYSQWVEYLGCFGLKEDRHLVINETDVEAGTQLRDCLLHCKQYNFIGLRQYNCVCLHYLLLNPTYIRTPCNTYPATCQGDQNAFCGDTKANSDAFAIYQKVRVTGRVGVGNCLAVRNNNSYNYEALDCSATAFQICLKDFATSTTFNQKNVSSGTWIDSFQLCKPSYMLARYSLVVNNGTFSRGTYWLSNTRRWIQGTFTSPEFCIAAKVEEDGHLERFPIRCDKKLHGLCASREIPDLETYGNKMTSPDEQPPINKVLLISVIAATSLIIIVAVVILIFCIRMKRLQSNSSQNQTVVDGKNVVYAQVDRSMNQDRTTNQTTGQSPVEDTYDHMDHRCLNQMPLKEESNYDTMSKVGIVEENDYSHTNETERERQCFIEASSEYSHVTIVAKPDTRD